MKLPRRNVLHLAAGAAALLAVSRVAWAQERSPIHPHQARQPNGTYIGSLETTGYVNDKSNVRRAIEPFHCQRDQ
jgi:hypothetical protein